MPLRADENYNELRALGIDEGLDIVADLVQKVWELAPTKDAVALAREEAVLRLIRALADDIRNHYDS